MRVMTAGDLIKLDGAMRGNGKHETSFFSISIPPIYGVSLLLESEETMENAIVPP
jgi:hypothetical protein